MFPPIVTDRKSTRVRCVENVDNYRARHGVRACGRFLLLGSPRPMCNRRNGHGPRSVTSLPAARLCTRPGFRRPLHLPCYVNAIVFGSYLATMTRRTRRLRLRRSYRVVKSTSRMKNKTFISNGGDGEEERELDARGYQRFLTGIIRIRPAVTYTSNARVMDKLRTRKSDGKRNIEIEINRGIVYVYIRIKFAKCHSPRRLLYIDYSCVINLCRSNTIHTRVTHARIL